MWDSAAKALQWIIDTLLKRRAEQASRREKQWLQVAEHMEKVASLVDLTVEDYKQGKLPEGHYARLGEVLANFDAVLARAFDKQDELQAKKIEDLKMAFDRALHVMDRFDALLLEVPTDRNGEQAGQFIADLEAAAGKFRGAADNLRATAG